MSRFKVAFVRRLVFSFYMSGIMSLMMSGIITLINTGLADGFLGRHLPLPGARPSHWSFLSRLWRVALPTARLMR